MTLWMDCFLLEKSYFHVFLHRQDPANLWELLVDNETCKPITKKGIKAFVVGKIREIFKKKHYTKSYKSLKIFPQPNQAKFQVNFFPPVFHL